MNQFKDWLEHFWLEQRLKAILCLIVLLLLLVSLLVNLPNLSSGVNTATRIEESLTLLTEKQAELQVLYQEKRHLSDPVQLLQAHPEIVWLAERDGNPNVEFRRRIENAAKASGITLKTIGAVQNSRTGSGAMAYEIAITGNCQYDEFFVFCDNLNSGTESRAIIFNALTLAPDNIHRPNFLLLNATLKIVVVTAPEILALWETAP